jgi:peptide/nickel transport system ATP-binding protein
LYKGRTLALVGESGSGKSTTGRALVGLSRPTAGTIFYGRRRIQLFNADDVRHLRSGVQMIFQDPFGSFNPRMSINDAIAEPLLCRGLSASRKEALDRAAFYLERVGLDPRMGQRYPHEFSGGQRQRISIAKAISMRPDVIVADEAVSALDVTTKMKIIDLLEDLQQAEGISILFISHDIAAVNKISHSIAVMHMGRIVEIGPKDQILKGPMHPYTQRLLSATLSIDTRKRRLPVDSDLGELTSPLHDLNYQVPELSMQHVGVDHFILQTA